jgi:hypothetical protein
MQKIILSSFHNTRYLVEQRAVSTDKLDELAVSWPTVIGHYYSIERIVAASPTAKTKTDRHGCVVEIKVLLRQQKKPTEIEAKKTKIRNPTQKVVEGGCKAPLIQFLRKVCVFLFW